MKILVTGGLGFIGSNVAMSFARKGHDVVVIDNLSRVGVAKNFKWLSEYDNINFRLEDIRAIQDYGKPDVVFHFAGQVGVQSSIDNPVDDFEINAQSTLKLLEHFRAIKTKPLIVFASTNKVYGDFHVVQPVKEIQRLSFCTPYGCSKGAADQYMLDYHRVYGLPTVVLRMSCIYGERQMGIEEQGWLCHFMRSKKRGEKVTVYGDGTQIRDALYIDDYVRLMHVLVENKDKVAGKAFNIGGGVQNTVSVNEALQKIGVTQVEYTDWRPSDQRYYVSDLTKITTLTGWKPEIGVDEGLKKLAVWVDNLESAS